MAIIKTCKISVYALATQINEITEFLHKSRIIEPIDDSGGVPERIIQNIEGELKRTEAALKVVERYKPHKHGILKKRRNAALSDYAMDRKETLAAIKSISEILSLSDKISSNNSKISDIKLLQGRLSDYKGFDLPLAGKSTEHTEAVAGRCKAFTAEAFEEKLKNTDIKIYGHVIRRTRQECLVWFVYLKSDWEKVVEFFKEIEFSKEDFITGTNTPDAEILRLEKKKEELEKHNSSLLEKLCILAKSRRMLELYYDRLLLKREKYRAIQAAENTEKTFVITGYVPENSVDELISVLEKRFSVAAEVEDAEEGEILPVAFSNNSFVRPVEDITANYSMPSETDIDPNPVMAVFYYWFFGMMFSDAGYGLLMMLVCGILGFSNILEKQKRSMLKMFFWCGVSTTLWGIAYGSFFGDLIGTVSKTFGKGNVEFLPVLIDPVNQALELLIISVAFGMVHILTALVIKFLKLWKLGDKKGAVYDVGLWIGVLTGLSIFAVGIGTNLASVKNTGLVISILSAVGLVLVGGRDKKSFIMRFFGGILSLYDITGFVGDILSYSRLMALGLATGVIASVVNVLGALGGNSPVGVIMFVLISIFGHGLNFAINMLGAYVHTNRLQYVEFYQKFYSGGGRRFKPLSLDTKYFNFQDS